ncbi:MAG: diguanylate cyclase [Chloroflexi bacterium]|nr:diguanylate cyclase [Chloroflexota bacterium]
MLAPVLLGLFAGVLGREEDRIRNQARTLDDARLRFTSLTHAAITNRNWDVSFHDAHIPTCWEVKGCDETECPVFGKQNMRCWLVAGTFCRGEVQGRFAQKLGNCAKCEVYLEAVENDPINQIGENFNSLMWVLREKEDMLTAANLELNNRYGELEVLQEKTRQQADTDLLTGLWNHGHFQLHMKSQLAKAKQNREPLSLLMLDLDFFKSVNDQFGHQKGDMVLKHVGELLMKQAGDGGYAARYGGEEFVIVLPGQDAPQAEKFANTLREEVKELARVVGLPGKYVAVSIGVADFPYCASDSESLISAADTALLFAKRKGRDQVAYFRDLSETELKEGDIDRLHSRLEGVSLQTVEALAEAVDSADRYAKIDSTMLVTVAKAMAGELGMDEEQADALALATRLHDIGKVGVPGSVLRKTDKLTPDEVSLVQRHPEIGQRILKEAEKIQELISAILYHHERWDGDGYPERLKGEEIPVMARIVGIMDSYRAMLSDRPYRKALTQAEALEELSRGAGTQFDPKMVKLFVKLIGTQSQFKKAS